MRKSCCVRRFTRETRANNTQRATTRRYKVFFIKYLPQILDMSAGDDFFGNNVNRILFLFTSDNFIPII